MENPYVYTNMPFNMIYYCFTSVEDRVHHLHMSAYEAFKLPDFNSRSFDIIYLMDEFNPRSLLYDMTVCFRQLNKNGVLIVGQWHDRDPTIKMEVVVEVFTAIFADEIARTIFIRDHVVIIKAWDGL